MGLKDVVIKEARPLPVLLLVDNSGSMANEKINTVNAAIREMMAEFSNIKNAKGKISIGVITFGNDVAVVQTMDKIENVQIPTFTAAGKTWMGKAIDMAIDMLEDRNQVPERAYTPTIILLSDGLPTDCPERAKNPNYDFNEWEPLKRLHSSERLKNCPKLALGIGEGSNYEMLHAFINNNNIPIIKAADTATITKFFKWVTFSISKRSVSSNPNEAEIGNPADMFGEEEMDYLKGLWKKEKQ